MTPTRVAGALALAFVLAALAPGPLGAEDHAFQRVEAFAFVVVGVLAARSFARSAWGRCALVAGGVALALDELFMIHECVRGAWRAPGVRDPFIVALAAAACAVAVVVARRAPTRARAAFAVAAGAAVVVALLDGVAWGAALPAHAALVEEGAEALASCAAALGCAWTPARGAPGAWRVPLVVACLALVPVAWALRLSTCPERVLSPLERAAIRTCRP